MEEELMIDEIRQLCITNGKAIDKIAKDTNISHDLIAKIFIQTMQTILDKMS